MKWHHDQLAMDLAEHLARNSDRVIWTDMQLGSSGSPRPDVYTINKSYSRFCPVAYECKVSVSDFRSDITKGKWQSYLKYSSGVIFAAPKGLINKEDIPKGCGLIVRSESGWRMVKGATMNTVKDLPRDLWMKLVIDGMDRSLRQHQTKHFNQRKIEMEVAKKYGDELAKLLANQHQAQNSLEIKIQFLKEKIGEVNLVHAVENATRQKEELDAIKSDLCQLFGVDAATTPIAALSRLAYEKTQLLDKDYQVRNLKRALKSTLEQSERQVIRLRELCEPIFNTHESEFK